MDEFEEGQSLEARVARSLDKLQMMVRVLKYESEGKGSLEEFWEYGGNFPLCGVKAVDRLFERVRALRGSPPGLHGYAAGLREAGVQGGTGFALRPSHLYGYARVGVEAGML